MLFHLGRYGSLLACDICDRARIHKTKVSLAVAALEKKRFLVRTASEKDRREEMLTLTPTGTDAFAHLYGVARQLTPI